MGLTIYYNDKFFSGIAHENGNVFGITKNKSKGRQINSPYCKYFKIVLTCNYLSVYYSDDGKTWTMYPEAYEVSGYFHQILGVWRSIKEGLYSIGGGKMIIDDFVYRCIK